MVLLEMSLLFGFPGGYGKELLASAGCRFDPCFWRRKWQPIPVILLKILWTEEPGPSPWGCKIRTRTDQIFLGDVLNI